MGNNFQIILGARPPSGWRKWLGSPEPVDLSWKQLQSHVQMFSELGQEDHHPLRLVAAIAKDVVHHGGRVIFIDPKLVTSSKTPDGVWAHINHSFPTMQTIVEPAQFPDLSRLLYAPNLSLSERVLFIHHMDPDPTTGDGSVSEQLSPVSMIARHALWAPEHGEKPLKPTLIISRNIDIHSTLAEHASDIAFRHANFGFLSLKPFSELADKKISQANTVIAVDHGSTKIFRHRHVIPGAIDKTSILEFTTRYQPYPCPMPHQERAWHNLRQRYAAFSEQKTAN